MINYIYHSGNFDEINEPQNISDHSRKTICFLMFVDEETEKYLRSSGRLGVSKKIGLWRIIVARNLPYSDARRTGKVRMTYLARPIMIEIKLFYGLLAFFVS
jgi:hypothetical protein